MARTKQLNLEFVKSIPERPEPETLYVSMEFASAVHLCCCGCDSEVVTPLSPKDWKLTFDGETITLHPSIGNWSFPCRSHYWIRSNRVKWAGNMTTEEIRQGREHDRWNRTKQPAQEKTETVSPEPAPQTRGFWKSVRGIFD